MTIKSYNHVLAVDQYRRIRANVVYIVNKKGAWGTYMGYEGGGAYADGYFWLKLDWKLIHSPDLCDFPLNMQKTLDELTDIRCQFEIIEEEDEGCVNDKGDELLFSDDAIWYENSEEYWSKHAEREVIVALSANWPVSIRWSKD